MTTNGYNKKVSFFRSIADQNPRPIDINTWLRGSPRYNPLIDEIRSQTDDDKIKALKKKLPCITPSCLATGRGEQNVVNHSGFIAPDLDKTDPAEAKEKLSQLPYIYYAGLSASGRGVWCLIPIKTPQRHSEHFNAIRSDLEDIGLEVDRSCKDVSRLRFYSYDTKPVFNPDASVYEKTITPPPPMYATHDDRDAFEKIALILSHIEKTKTDITGCYRDWVLIGGTLANLFGEGGRGLFHDFSKYYPGYSFQECNAQFSTCLRYRKNFTIGVIFNIAKEYDIYAKPDRIPA